MKIDLKNKKVAVVGLGLEGEASVKYLKSQGANVTGLDKKQGKDYLKGLEKYSLIVRSPGVKLSTLTPYVKEEKITSQTKLFFDLCPAEIIGITGTKGKGTTASLIYEIFKKQSLDVYLAGNIGRPLFEILDKLNVQSKVILELSSFQLLDLSKSPHIAVLLMVTSEHMDYHKTLQEYIDAKRNILRFQDNKDFAVINKDYPASNESDILTKGKVFQVSTEQEILKNGAFIKDNAIWFKNGIEEEFIIEISHVLLPGKHNLENILPAIVVSKLYNIPNETIISVLENFKGLEHRLELVAEIEGVKYYDDSFSTTPETAIAAIKAFSKPEILIIGGSSKKSDFRNLGEIISKAQNIKAIIGIGVEWPKIKRHIVDPKRQIILVEGAKNMSQVILAASKIAKKGDIVLLSPACASFDMFKNYKDRGEQFKEEVKKLQENFNG